MCEELKPCEQKCVECPLETILREIHELGFICDDGELGSHRGYIALVARAHTLQAQLEQYRWIPVEERLPEEVTKIIATSTPEKEHIQTFDVLCYEPTYHCVWIKRRYTHWMPMPPLPEDKCS